MESASVTRLLDNFLAHGWECAYVQQRGYRSERWSYAQVASAAFQCARELESRNIRKSDHVMIWGANRAEWVAVFFGCALHGIVAVPMDDAASPDFARRVCEQVGAKLVVCSRRHAHEVSTPSLILEDLLANIGRHSAAPCPACAIEQNDPLEIIFTSGTTAAPKGVVISHGNVLANLLPFEDEIRSYGKYERWVHPVRFLNLLPLSHVFGQFLGIFIPPLLAGTTVFQDSLNPSEVMETIRRERVSALVAVPRMLQSLREKIERDLGDAGERVVWEAKIAGAEGKHFLWRWWMFRRIHRQFGWRFWAFISGGAALDYETEQFWGRLGFAVIQGYGLTETTSLISVNHPFRLGKGSIGKILPGREVKLAEDGEILVRGGGVASAYWDAGGRQPVAGDDGWYHTGDIGDLDSAGNLHFKGRKKEVLVTPAGMNIYPGDLEAALRRQPEVRDCAIVGVDRGGNAEPCAVLILRGGQEDAGAVVGRANRSLAEYQRLRHWLVWPESDFPRTSTQKQRSSIIGEFVQARMEAGRKSPTQASPLAELITQVTGRTISRLGPEAKLDDDLQLSSLERVALLGALEDRFQIDLSETGFSATRTVGDLEKMLAGEGGRHAVYHYPRWALRWPIPWLRFAAYYLLVRPAIMLLGWPRIEGRENLRGVGGPVLVIANHVDDVDVGFIQTALPARLRHRLATATGGEALEALRTPAPERRLLGRLYDRAKWALGVALLNLFPLPREAAFLKSFAYAGECVDRGYSVLVFPEGHHTSDGKLLPFRAGAGLLASRLAIPVVPMRIDGLFEVKQSGRKFAAPGRIRVRIGKPIKCESDGDARAIAQELQKRIQEL
jgi:long-chain acyl-CoA synthetase